MSAVIRRLAVAMSWHLAHMTTQIRRRISPWNGDAGNV